ncbi:tetratricopeptide repeat protein [Candidatus Gottesmanbacteria bacterium]|nr:tetratricopeptide repeat protein [Candidatus Gottesmanbacteria bacterium]
MQKLDEVTSWIAIVALGVVPIFFLPVTADYYDFNKWSLLAVSALIVLFFSGLRLALTGRITLYWSAVTTALLALAGAAGASTLLVSSNKAEAAVSPFGLVTYASLFFLTLLTPAQEKKIKTFLFWFLTAGAGVLSLVTLYQALGIGKFLFPSLSFVGNRLWSPFGSSLGLLGFLLVTFPLVTGAFLRHLKKKEETEAILTVATSLMILLGFGATLWQLLAQSPPILPMSAAWTVFLNVLRNPLHAVFGVGPENFLAAYTLGKPAVLNTTALWSIRYTASASYFLHVATTLGLAGILGASLLLRSIIVPILRAGFSFTAFGLLATILMLLFLPPSLPLFVVTIAALLLATQGVRPIAINLTKQHEWTSLATGGLLIVAALVGGYGFARVYLAEVSFASALVAIDHNDGNATYQALLTTVSRNPYPFGYHATLSQTSFSLATAILNRASDAKVALSPSDKQLVTDFYQQAIREAKIAINAAPTSVIMWENLATIYRGFLGIATNSDTWAIAAFSQAIALDPTNPLLRVQLGSVYLRTNRLEEAIASFQSAIALKDDLANAHYHLAFAYRQKKQYLQAVIEFRRTSQLVRPGSTDADRVASDLVDVMAKLSSEDITRLSQTSIQPQAASTNEILSPVVEFQPIPTPKISFPSNSSLSPQP